LSKLLVLPKEEEKEEEEEEKEKDDHKFKKFHQKPSFG
jgi:hypothetical protein